MSFSEFHRMNIITKNNFSDEDYEKIKYGYRVLYINLSKTFVLFICAVFLNILKETAVLLCAFPLLECLDLGFTQKIL